MSYYGKEKYKETKKSKTARVWLAIFYFIEVVLTTFSYMWGPVEVDGKTTYKVLTAFEIAIQPEGYANGGEVGMAIICGILVLFPAIVFFFFVLNKSNIKYYLSIICCLVCVGIITFGVGTLIAKGALIALLLYVLILFVSTYGLISNVSVEQKKDENTEVKTVE